MSTVLQHFSDFFLLLSCFSTTIILVLSLSFLQDFCSVFVLFWGNFNLLNVTELRGKRSVIFLKYFELMFLWCFYFCCVIDCICFVAREFQVLNQVPFPWVISISYTVEFCIRDSRRLTNSISCTAESVSFITLYFVNAWCFRPLRSMTEKRKGFKSRLSLFRPHMSLASESSSLGLRPFAKNLYKLRKFKLKIRLIIRRYKL